ncbi:MAG: hypothetical protein Q7S92_06580 [Candidatus Diapherotrites archaeon]|nr:hypothetical protein [Candidatus Diapherotrites archaeon]
MGKLIRGPWKFKLHEPAKTRTTNRNRHNQNIRSLEEKRTQIRAKKTRKQAIEYLDLDLGTAGRMRFMQSPVHATAVIQCAEKIARLEQEIQKLRNAQFSNQERTAHTAIKRLLPAFQTIAKNRRIPKPVKKWVALSLSEKRQELNLPRTTDIDRMLTEIIDLFIAKIHAPETAVQSED